MSVYLFFHRGSNRETNTGSRCDHGECFSWTVEKSREASVENLPINDKYTIKEVETAQKEFAKINTTL